MKHFFDRRKPVSPGFISMRNAGLKLAVPSLDEYRSFLPAEGVGLVGDMPLVSVITTVLNGERHLESAIRSVIDQDYPYLEYIIIDGGSSDATLDIVRKHGSRITAWISEPDEGIFDGMNKGIAMSRGRLIKLLNADDELTTTAVSRAVAFYDHSVDPVVIASDIDFINEAGKRLKVIDRSRFMNPVGPVLHPSWFVDRRLYDRLGLYRTDLRCSSDFEMFLRFNHNGVEFKYVDQPLVRFRAGGVSTRTSLGVGERYKVMKQYYSRSLAIRTALRHITKKLRSRLLLSLLGEKRLYRLRARIGGGNRVGRI